MRDFQNVSEGHASAPTRSRFHDSIPLHPMTLASLPRRRVCAFIYSEKTMKERTSSMLESSKSQILTIQRCSNNCSTVSPASAIMLVESLLEPRLCLELRLLTVTFG